MHIKARTLGRLFLSRTDTSATRNAIGWIENLKLRFYTYKEYRNIVECLSLAFLSKNLKPQDKVAIIGETCKEWHLVDLSVICSRGISIPVYHTYTAEDVAYIIEHSEAKMIFVSDETQLRKVLNYVQDFKELNTIITMDEVSEKAINQVPPHIQVSNLKSMIELGSGLITEQPDVFQSNIDSASEQDVASIIYTSGTTGKAKGAIITHRAFTQMLFNIEKSTHKAFNFNDRSLTFLPLSHVFGRCDSFLPLIFGWECVYARSSDKVLEDLKIVRPTVMLSVPRVFEKIYQRIQHQISDSSIFSQKVVELAVDAAKKYFEVIDQHKSPSSIDILKYHLAYKSVFDKIYNTFGGRIRFFISGGAPIDSDIIKFLRYANLTIVEGYGLTETVAPCALNPFSKQIPGTVGRPIGDVEFKFKEDGEVLIKSDALFSGYYKDEEATKDAFEGPWFKTGDIGHFTSDGHLKITDRKKNIIITSGGKNVSPQRIESIMTSDPHIASFVVVGEGKKYLVGLVALEKESFGETLSSLGLDETAPISEIVKIPEIIQIVEKCINDANQKLARFETIKKFYILPIELTVENYLTPSLKVKRNELISDYKQNIDSLYQS